MSAFVEFHTLRGRAVAVRPEAVASVADATTGDAYGGTWLAVSGLNLRVTESYDKVTAALEAHFAETERKKEERPPHTPLKEKEAKPVSFSARACVRAKTPPMVKPTVDEVAAHIRAKGYTFDAEAFWAFYESKGWYVGNRPMKDWKSACVTWQKRERDASLPSHAPKSANYVTSTPEQRKAFSDELESYA